ncbi:MAG: class I SAM-dependent methyltransferase [Ferruginibacter sp.]|nr:class I SAM-dependent methyltransferase [Ferruginibacter sp.]
MKAPYNHAPLEVIAGKNRQIAVFSTDGDNIEPEVVKSFGEEWLKFNDFSDETIAEGANEYFDILNNIIINKNSYVLDIGCGTGRWTKFLSSKVGFIEAVDPSNAIFAADKLLGKTGNVRLTMASTDNIPFDDDTFDFVMSIGVLHHIPDTQQAMQDCVKKVKRGGYFYCYLYHNLENMNWFLKGLFNVSETLRKVISKLSSPVKRFVCDVLAVVVYMPFIIWVRVLMALGLKKLAMKMPLSGYYNKSFFVVRNDSLDKFGTALEQRFSKQEVDTLMKNCGLEQIVISNGSPRYHTVGRKK